MKSLGQTKPSLNLPVEVKRTILMHLSPQEAARAGRIDRGFLQASSDPSLWQRSLVPERYRSDAVKQMHLGQCFNRWIGALPASHLQQLKALKTVSTEDEAQRWLIENFEIPGFAELIIHRFPAHLGDAPYSVRGNIHLLAMSIAQEGCNIRFASQAHRASASLGLMAVTQNGWAIEYLSSELQASKAIRAAALKNIAASTYIDNRHNASCASRALQEDKDIAQILASQSNLSACCPLARR